MTRLEECEKPRHHTGTFHSGQIVTGLPGLTNLYELTIPAHPPFDRVKYPCINGGQNLIDQFGEPATLGSGTNGVMLLKLGFLEFA